jgi:hypothetical protein
MFFDGIEHGDAFPWRREINLVIPQLHFHGTVDRQGSLADHLFHHFHHPDVVLVGDVHFEHGELGVVVPVHPLVAEVLGELIHAIISADNQSLQVQLVCNTKVEVNVQCVVMCNERPGERTAIQRLEDGGLDFEMNTSRTCGLTTRST